MFGIEAAMWAVAEHGALALAELGVMRDDDGFRWRVAWNASRATGAATLSWLEPRAASTARPTLEPEVIAEVDSRVLEALKSWPPGARGPFAASAAIDRLTSLGKRSVPVLTDAIRRFEAGGDADREFACVAGLSAFAQREDVAYWSDLLREGSEACAFGLMPAMPFGGRFPEQSVDLIAQGTAAYYSHGALLVASSEWGRRPRLTNAWTEWIRRNVDRAEAVAIIEALDLLAVIGDEASGELVSRLWRRFTSEPDLGWKAAAAAFLLGVADAFAPLMSMHRLRQELRPAITQVLDHALRRVAPTVTPDNADELPHVDLSSIDGWWAAHEAELKFDFVAHGWTWRK